VPGQARSQVGHQGNAENLGAHLPGGDRLEDRRHSDQVGAEPAEHGDLRRRLVVRPRQHGVDPLGQARVGVAGQRAQPRRVQAGQVDEPRAGRRRRAGQRRRPGQVQVIADQHRLPDRQPGADRAGRVGQHHRAAAGGDRRAHPVHHGRRRQPLVQVHPAEEHQRPQRPGADRPHRGRVARHGGLGEPAEFGQRDLGVRGADRVGGRRPARAEDHRDVVPPGPGDQPGGAGRRGREWVTGHDSHHDARRQGGRSPPLVRPDCAVDKTTYLRIIMS